MGATCCSDNCKKGDDEVKLSDYCKDKGSVSEQQSVDMEKVSAVNEGKKEAIEVFNGFQMEILWKFDVNGGEETIPVDKLILCKDKCKFFGQGTDQIGRFSVVGDFLTTGDVVIKLIHSTSDMLGKIFEGKFEENTIVGNWSNGQAQKGKFKLELVSNVWHTPASFIALKGLQELVGIGKFSYGYGILTGTPKGDDSGIVHLDIFFGDGKTGVFDFSFKEDGIQGILETPNGKEEVNLVLRNEFA